MAPVMPNTSQTSVRTFCAMGGSTRMSRTPRALQAAASVRSRANCSPFSVQFSQRGVMVAG